MKIENLIAVIPCLVPVYALKKSFFSGIQRTFLSIGRMEILKSMFWIFSLSTASHLIQIVYISL